MGFPIAYGAKTVSSRPIALHPEPLEDYADDGVLLKPAVSDSYRQPLVAMTTNSVQDLAALVTITYYDMLRDDNLNDVAAVPNNNMLLSYTTCAEVRIQISPLALPFSSNYRETVHRIALPDSTISNEIISISDATTTRTDASLYQPVVKQPSIVFSSDGRHLACLIPFPPRNSQQQQRQQQQQGSRRPVPQSSVVIFQLRKPRSRSTTIPQPTQPSYVTPHMEVSPSSTVMAPVATNPRIVHGLNLSDVVPLPNGDGLGNRHDHTEGDRPADEPLLLATSLCDVSMSHDRTDRAASVLIAGCSNGSILVVGYRTGRVAGTLIAPTASAEHADDEVVDFSFHHMTHITTSSGHPPISTIHDDRSSKGRLLAIRSNGRASIYQSHLVVTTYSTSTTDVHRDSMVDHSSASHHSMTESPAERISNTNGTASTNYHYLEKDNSERSSHRRLPVVSPITPAKPILAREVSYSPSTGATSAFQQQQQQQHQRQLLMHLDFLTDLEGPFVSATWINGCLLATLPNPFYSNAHQGDDHVKAQVWAIPNNTGIDQDDMEEPLVKQPLLSCLDMTESRLKETAHIMYDFEMPYDDIDSEVPPTEGTWNKCLAIHYDDTSGCLAVSSVVVDQEHGVDSSTTNRPSVRPFSCIWHWRSNVVGFTATTPNTYGENDTVGMTFLAQLYFGCDPHRGLCLSHFAAALGSSEDTDCRISKTSFAIAILSPAASSNQSSWSVAEPCPLLLSASTVSFPYVSNPMSNDAVEIEWKESAIPTTYIGAYGPPRIAAIARGTGRSIAVASTRGLCILECPKQDVNLACRHTSINAASKDKRRLVHRQSSFSRVPQGGKLSWRGGLGSRWRFFGSEAEERAFRVLSMAWWEGAESPEGSVDESWTETLLIAIVQLESKQSDEADASRHRYLACWSPRRLDVGHQLIQPARSSRYPSTSQWGIPLPENFIPTSLTLLSEPVNTASFRGTSFRKAVVLLSAPTKGSDGETGVRYSAYQLQVKAREEFDVEPPVAQLPYVVVANSASNGEVRLRDHSAALSIVSGIFLAGAAFTFGLSTKDELPHSDEREEYVCTLGIIRSPGGGLHGVAVTTAGATVAAPVLMQGSKICDVLMYFLSDVVLGNKQDDKSDQDATASSYHVWTIERADGQIFCWFVPSTCGNPRQRGEKLCTIGTAKDSVRSATTRLTTPSLVFGSEVERDSRGYLLGSVCAIGEAATWMQESLSTNRSNFLLGPAPNSSFGCMMGVCQSSWRLHREIDGFDHASFATNVLDIDCLALGDLVLYSPLFVTSLYAIFMEAARINAEFNPGIDGTPRGHERPKHVRSIPSNHARYRVTSNPNKDMVMMALRLLVIRAVEFVATEVRKLDKPNQQESSRDFVLAMSFFAEVVDAIRACTTQLQFASFFLEVGRQVEPSYSCHLFPLPMPIDAYGADIKDFKYVCNVDDLFGLSLKEGSLSVAASALPLFTTRRQSRRVCVQLLRHCLLVFQENVVSLESVKFDISGEERRYVNDILQFGLRLEDVESYRGKKSMLHRPLENAPVEHPQHDIRRTSLQKRENETSFLRFLPSWFYDNGSKREEKEIYEAASSFILLGFEESTYEYIEREKEKDEAGVLDEHESDGHEDEDDSESVAGVVARSLLAVAFASKGASPCLKWKRTVALARLLLGDIQNTPRSQTSQVLDCTDVLQDIRLREMDSLVKQGVKGTGSANVQKENGVVQFLVVRILECMHECVRSEVDLLLDLVLLLLTRYDISDDLDAEIPGLLLIGVIASHVTDRVDAIIGQLPPTCPICVCYAKVCDELQHTI